VRCRDDRSPYTEKNSQIRSPYRDRRLVVSSTTSYPVPGSPAEVVSAPCLAPRRLWCHFVISRGEQVDKLKFVLALAASCRASRAFDVNASKLSKIVVSAIVAESCANILESPAIEYKCRSHAMLTEIRRAHVCNKQFFQLLRISRPCCYIVFLGDRS